VFLRRALPVGGFVQWYNHEHRHRAINFVTPAQPHAGEDHALLAKRVAIYQAAKEQHPERWSSEIRNWQRIDIVHLNPEKKDHRQGATSRTQKGSINLSILGDN